MYRSAATLKVVQDGPSRLRLIGELDLAAAPKLNARLARLDGDLDVECAGLTFIDVAGMRLLLGVHESCRSRGAKLTIVNPPQCVVRLAGLMGVDGPLDVRSDGSPA